MALKTLIVLMGCMSLARAGIAAVRAVDAEYDPHPQYSYGYDVQDSLTGDSKTHQETRDGDVVQGQYSLIDSDGTRRVVDYTADPINGFNAVVRKEALVGPVVAAPAPVVSAPAIVDGPTIVDARAGPVVAARTVAAPVLAAPATGVIAARTVAQPLFAPAARYAAAPVAYSAAAPVAYSAAAPVAYSAAAPVAYSAAAPVAYSAAGPVAYSAAGPVAYSAGPVAYSAAGAPVAYSAGPVAYSAAPYAYNGLASYSSPFARFASPVGYAAPYTTLL